MALALTLTKENQKVLIGRNCHRSVISGITLTGAIPVWITPQRHEQWGIWGAIEPKEVEEAS
ncbi:MAG: hypothetical protein MZV70_70020 [Desulfobacterales bacterium]|nr:hypothetical protein [Desulfobacterales bacterium]